MNPRAIAEVVADPAKELEAGNYSYVYDPQHLNRPRGGNWEKTEQGWSTGTKKMDYNLDRSNSYKPANPEECDYLHEISSKVERSMKGKGFFKELCSDKCLDIISRMDKTDLRNFYDDLKHRCDGGFEEDFDEIDVAVCQNPNFFQASANVSGESELSRAGRLCRGDYYLNPNPAMKLIQNPNCPDDLLEAFASKSSEAYATNGAIINSFDMHMFAENSTKHAEEATHHLSCRKNRSSYSPRYPDYDGRLDSDDWVNLDLEDPDEDDFEDFVMGDDDWRYEDRYDLDYNSFMYQGGGGEDYY